jgi:hypothetical protein
LGRLFPDRDQAVYLATLRRQLGENAADFESVLAMRDQIGPFLEACLARFERPRSTSTFRSRKECPAHIQLEALRALQRKGVMLVNSAAWAVLGPMQMGTRRSLGRASAWSSREEARGAAGRVDR